MKLASTFFSRMKSLFMAATIRSAYFGDRPVSDALPKGRLVTPGAFGHFRRAPRPWRGSKLLRANSARVRGF